jgi:hypothetical protein
MAEGADDDSLDTTTAFVLSEGQVGQHDQDGTPNGRKRKCRSPIWNYFDKVEGNYAVCTICKSKYQHSNNTSTFHTWFNFTFDSIYKVSTRQNGLFVRKKERQQRTKNRRGNWLIMCHSHF